jgi:hypothetical protein
VSGFMRVSQLLTGTGWANLCPVGKPGARLAALASAAPRCGDQDTYLPPEDALKCHGSEHRNGIQTCALITGTALASDFDGMWPGGVNHRTRLRFQMKPAWSFVRFLIARIVARTLQQATHLGYEKRSSR